MLQSICHKWDNRGVLLHVRDNREKLALVAQGYACQKYIFRSWVLNDTLRRLWDGIISYGLRTFPGLDSSTWRHAQLQSM